MEWSCFHLFTDKVELLGILCDAKPGSPFFAHSQWTALKCASDPSTRLPITYLELNMIRLSLTEAGRTYLLVESRAHQNQSPSTKNNKCPMIGRVTSSKAGLPGGCVNHRRKSEVKCAAEFRKRGAVCCKGLMVVSCAAIHVDIAVYSGSKRVEIPKQGSSFTC